MVTISTLTIAQAHTKAPEQRSSSHTAWSAQDSRAGVERANAGPVPRSTITSPKVNGILSADS